MNSLPSPPYKPYELTDVFGKKIERIGISQLVEFLRSEAAFWKERQESSDINPSQLHPYICHEYLNDVIQTIGKKIHRFGDGTYNEEASFEKIQNLLQQNLKHKWLSSEHPHLDEFVRCNELYGQRVAGSFLRTVIFELNGDNPDISPSIQDEVEGQVRAFVFLKEQEFRGQFQEVLDDSKAKISELEKTYEEKLRLEKPAEYWKKAGQRFKNQAHGWSIILVLFVLAGIVLFSCFFLYWADGQEIPIKLDTVHGVVVFSAVLALYAFLIRVLSRLTFSAYHLMRDAEEREQLTYLYLSLTKEKVLDENSRNLILQALFSRSDTGLLSRESGPSMPIASEIKDLATGNK